MQKKLVILSMLACLLAAVPASAVKVYRTKSEGLADVKVYETSSEGLADKKIYYTKSEGLAKCDVDWKGYKKSMAQRFSGSCDASKFSEFALIRDLVLAPNRCGRS